MVLLDLLNSNYQKRSLSVDKGVSSMRTLVARTGLGRLELPFGVADRRKNQFELILAMQRLVLANLSRRWR